nr:uncharacterized protein LOC113802369 [Penaeus vannamei]
MKGGKAVGPDSIPVDAWRILEMVVTWLTRLFNKFLVGEKMPEEWRKSVLVPILRTRVMCRAQQLHRGTTDAIFALRMLRRSPEKMRLDESPWTMMLADDTVLSGESREESEEELGR